ncbi:hypothetical protein [Embleya scabrispora]|uniref:hypothetical protein n=1 Tax=Embleya scabrispora TaxID=159449 RepID=UPI00036EF05E|nr:hypothetical protein [Embleya scabrispora]MYS87977.1 hypothetical protein [Streptomyces sp. SID5474]
MGQVAADGAPARHGVCRVIVLIALMALLHATHVPGAAHRAAPDPDRCAVGAVGRAAPFGTDDVPGDGRPGDHSVRSATPAGETGGRHGPAVGPACAPTTARPRHHSTTASASALVDTVGSRLADQAEVGEIRARTAASIPGSIPSRTVVLRC